jgi:hypothetical protein
MEKSSLRILLFSVVVITSVLVIPISGISAERDNISKEVQLCCYDTEETYDNFLRLLVINSLPMSDFPI